MTISIQWLIFGGVGIGLFLFGLLAKDGESGKSAKEDHMQSSTENLLEKAQQHEVRDEKQIAAAHASRH
jgi:hypothetical protein